MTNLIFFSLVGRPDPSGLPPAYLLNWSNFYHTKRSVARYCHDKLSVRLSVRPSVTLVDCDDTRWNSAKIASWLISLGTWVSADSNITDLLQREHPKILARIGVG